MARRTVEMDTTIETVLSSSCHISARICRIYTDTTAKLSAKTGALFGEE